MITKSKLKELVVVTTNPGKIDEINKILGTSHKVSNIDIPEIQSIQYPNLHDIYWVFHTHSIHYPVLSKIP